MFKNGTLDWDWLLNKARETVADFDEARDGEPPPHTARCAVRALWESLNRAKEKSTGLLLGPDEIMRVAIAIVYLERLGGAQPMVPTHRTTMHLPRGGDFLVAEVLPTGRTNLKGSCKYCYTTHRDWWQMPPDQYGGEDVVLCGKCEHTMLKEGV